MLCSYMVVSEPSYLVLTYSYKDTSYTGLVPDDQKTLFYLSYLYEGCIPKYSHIPKYRRLGLHYKFREGTQLSP